MFIELFTKSKINQAVIEKLHHHLYKKKNTSLFCKCFLSSLEKRRVKKFLQAEEEQNEPEEQKTKEGTSWITNIITLYGGYTDFQDIVQIATDLGLIMQFYRITMEQIDKQMPNKVDYLVLLILTSFLFVTKFFISCSTMNFMVYYEGDNGALLNQMNKSCCAKIFMFLKFTCIGPLIFVVMKIFKVLEVCVFAFFVPTFLVQACCCKGYNFINMY